MAAMGGDHLELNIVREKGAGVSNQRATALGEKVRLTNQLDRKIMSYWDFSSYKSCGTLGRDISAEDWIDHHGSATVGVTTSAQLGTSTIR